MKRNLILKTILDAKAAAGVGNSINIGRYTNKQLTFDTDGGGTAALTVKFQTSHQEDAPDFAAAQSVTNQWDYCAVRDRQDNSVIAGDTGIAVSSADDHRQVNLEDNGAEWVNAIVSGYSAGSVTVKIRMTNS